MKHKKETPPKRSYSEVMEDFQKAQTSKEYRAIHKEIKRNKYGSVPIWYRYPHIPLIVSGGSLLFSIIVLILKSIR